jgi:hypothetical protein
MRPHALRLANLVVFQIAWFAAVLGAAHGMPLWGTVCVLGAIAWHLGVAKEPAKEALLVGIVCVLGFALESIHAAHGLVRYRPGNRSRSSPPTGWWRCGACWRSRST